METILLLLLQLGTPGTSSSDVRELERIERDYQRIINSYDRSEMRDLERRQTEAIEARAPHHYDSVVLPPDDYNSDRDSRVKEYPYRY